MKRKTFLRTSTALKSGMKNGNLASAIELVTGTGEVINLSRAKDGDKFNGAVVGLGSLGIITKVTLDVQKSFLDAQSRAVLSFTRKLFIAKMPKRYSY
jgi:FAD/FMN-containing dehydrogenase